MLVNKGGKKRMYCSHAIPHSGNSNFTFWGNFALKGQGHEIRMAGKRTKTEKKTSKPILIYIYRSPILAKTMAWLKVIDHLQ